MGFNCIGYEVEIQRLRSWRSCFDYNWVAPHIS